MDLLVVVSIHEFFLQHCEYFEVSIAFALFLR